MKTIISSQRNSLSFEYENQRKLMKEERFAGKQNSAGEMGHRIAKHSYDKDQAYNNGLGQLVKSTYYVLDAQGNTMATYERSIDNGQTSLTYTQTEKFIYGSSRLGVQNCSTNLLGSAGTATYVQLTVPHRIGKKGYELSNHLGNVLSVISDKAIPHDNGGVVDYFLADIRQAQDFSPFGVLLQNRNLSLSGANPYRYLHQGQEMDDEVKGEGNSYDFGARMYDSRLGRFLSLDAYLAKFANQTPYVYAANTPIWAVDNNGDSVLFYSEQGVYLGYSNDNQMYKGKNLLVIIADKDLKAFYKEYHRKRSSQVYPAECKTLEQKAAYKEAVIAGLEGMGITFDITNYKQFYNKYKDKGVNSEGKVETVKSDDGYTEFGSPLSDTQNPVYPNKKNWKTIEDKNVVIGEGDNHIVWDKNFGGEIHLHTPWLESQPSGDDWNRQATINKTNPDAFGIVINGEQITFYKYNSKGDPVGIPLDFKTAFKNTKR